MPACGTCFDIRALASCFFPRRRVAAAWLAVALAVLIGLAGCAVQPLPPDAIPLADAVSARLAIAKDVAWAKWADGLPVRDREREDVVVSRFVSQAEAAGLNEDAAAQLIRAQIEASCIEQERWMKSWRQGEGLPAGEPPALGTLRQRLDRISFKLLAEWAAVEGSPLPAAALKARLIQEGFSSPAARAASAFTR